MKKTKSPRGIMLHNVSDELSVKMSQLKVQVMNKYPMMTKVTNTEAVEFGLLKKVPLKANA